LTQKCSSRHKKRQ